MSKRPILLTTLAFTVIGPLIGALLVIALEVFYAFVTGRIGTLTHDFMMFDLIVLVWAYALGCLPSAAMGFFWAVFFARFQSRLSLTPFQRAISGVCLGIIVGAIAGLLWDWIASTSLEQTRLIYLCTPCSLIAGCLLCIAYPRAIWLQRRPLTSGSSDRGEAPSVG